MKLQVLQEDLKNAANIGIRFISTRSTLPILGNFLLIAEKTSLRIEATNLEMSVSIKLGAVVEEEGKMTLPAKTFTDLILNLEKGQINLSEVKEKLDIVGNGFEASIATQPANDFPTIPVDLDDKLSFTLGGQTLINALSKILFSVSTDETRPVLTGVLFVFDAPEATNSSTLSLVASDGFRLSRITLKLDREIKAKNIIIPKNSLLELLKIGKTEKEIKFQLKESENQLIIKVGEMVLSTRLIDGNFPDFQKIIPLNSATKISLNKNDLSRGLKLAGVFARAEDSGIVKMSILENEVELSSENAKFGKQKNKIEASVEGGTLDVLYNFKFVEDFLNIIEGNNIEIKLTDGGSPGIFVDPKDESFLHLIMPVKVQS
jgi:DNA polymerase III subunit beta